MPITLNTFIKISHPDGFEYNESKASLLIKNSSISDVFIISDTTININGSVKKIQDLIFDNCRIKELEFKHINNINYIALNVCKGEKLTISNVEPKERIHYSNSDFQDILFENIKCHDIYIIPGPYCQLIPTFQFKKISAHKIDLFLTSNVNALVFLDIETEDMLSLGGANNKINSVGIINKVPKLHMATSPDNPMKIKKFSVSLNSEKHHYDINGIEIETFNFQGKLAYTNLILNIHDLIITKQIFFNNVNLNQSIFKNIDLSKCIFSNSLISEVKFYECKADYISDIPLEKLSSAVSKVWKIITALIAALFLLNLYINNPTIQQLIASLLITVILGSAILLLFLKALSIIFVKAKHRATLDEINIIDTKKSALDFMSTDLDQDAINTNEKLESIYRQLKVSFEKDSNRQMGNEFLYSEGVMKLRQKPLRLNLINVDFWNYLVNGFGRRWRRAGMNFITMSIFFTLFFSAVTWSYKVTDKAPGFLRDNNITVPVNEQWFQELPNIVKLMYIPTQTIFQRLEVGTAYTLSKIDLFRIKTNGWFEEKSIFALIGWNFLGLILVFLFGSFVLAFKRRLEK